MLEQAPRGHPYLSAVLAAITMLQAPGPTPTPRPTPLRPTLGTHGGTSFVPIGAVSSSIDGFAFALVPHRHIYIIGRPVYIGLYFENTTRYDGSYDPKAIEWNISGPSVTRHGLRRGDSLYLTHYRNDIPTDKSISSEVDLTNFADFAAPGVYTIRATVTMRRPPLRLNSAPVTIQLRLPHITNRKSS